MISTNSANGAKWRCYMHVRCALVTIPLRRKNEVIRTNCVIRSRKMINVGGKRVSFTSNFLRVKRSTSIVTDRSSSYDFRSSKIVQWDIPFAFAEQTRKRSTLNQITIWKKSTTKNESLIKSSNVDDEKQPMVNQPEEIQFDYFPRCHVPILIEIASVTASLLISTAF